MMLRTIQNPTRRSTTTAALRGYVLVTSSNRNRWTRVATSSTAALSARPGRPQPGIHAGRCIGSNLWATWNPIPNTSSPGAVPAARVLKVPEAVVDAGRWSKADQRRFLKLGGAA